jgi:ApaG protein
MFTHITNGISISVEVFYIQKQSMPQQNEFSFAYHITIENNSEHIIKLMRRHWRIMDSNGDIRTVEGEGVVGQQPVMQPGEYYQYTSGCVLNTEMGKMQGTYTMKDVHTTNLFDVLIPAFDLIVPFKMN